MGFIDKLIRVAVAVAIVALYALGYLSGTLAIVLLVVSAIFLVTSALSFCPLYVPLKLNTGAKEE